MLKGLRKQKGTAGQQTLPTINHSPLTINYSLLTSKGQVILEFTFCMIVLLIMLYGVARVFFWTGRDLVERRKAHDTVLFNQAKLPVEQVDPYFYTPGKMNAIWKP